MEKDTSMSFPVKVLEKTEKRLSAPKIDNITNTKKGVIPW